MGEPVEVLEGSDSEINRLFPKCRPRLHGFTPSFNSITTNYGPPDVNRNCVSDANDNYASVTSVPDDDVTSQPDDMSSGGSSRMSVDASSPTPASHCSSSPSSNNAYFPQTPSSRECAPPIDNENDDLSVVSAYLDERFSTAILDSSYEESLGSGGQRSSPSANSHKLSIAPVPPSENDISHKMQRREHFRLCDSRIEKAGGKEMFSQSRSRTARKRHEEGRRTHHTFPYHYNQPLIHHSHHHYQHQHAMQLQKQPAPPPLPHQHQQQELSSPVEGEFQRKDSHSSSTTRSNSSNSHSNSGSSSSSSTGRSSSRESKEGPDTEGLDDEANRSPEKEGDVVGASTLVYETRLSGSSEVVFDDISEWVERGLTVSGADGGTGIHRANRSSKVLEQRKQPQQHFITPPTPPSQTESEYDDEEDDEDEDSPTRVTQIGSVQIAEYEGSPRRYGQPQRPPRPGFPRRVSSGSGQERNGKGDFKKKSRSGQFSDSKGLLAAPQIETENVIVSEGSGRKVSVEGGDDPEEDGNISISTLTSSYATSFPKTPTKMLNTASTSVPPPENDIQGEKAKEFYEEFSFEESETKKVLQEFFDSRGKSPNDFYDLQYTLKRQHGNSYVGQRLAAVECEDEADPSALEGAESNREISDRNIDEKNRSNSRINSHQQSTQNIHPEENSEDQRNSKLSNVLQTQENGTGLQLENGNGSQQDNGMCIHQENGGGPEQENSEMGISRNFTLSPETTSCDSLDVESEFSAGEGEGSIPSSGKIVNTMPVLEDGLSSGEESEMEAVDESRFFGPSDAQEMLRHQLFQNSQNQHLYATQHPSEVNMPFYDERKIGEIEEETEMEKERTLQRARSLDNQLCRGELPLPSSLAGGHYPGAYSHIHIAPMNVSSVPSYTVTTSYSPVPFPDNSPHPHATSSPQEKVSQVSMLHDSDGMVITSNHTPSKTTLSLMKKQISEIEREIAMKKPEGGQGVQRKHNCDGDIEPSAPNLDLHLLDPLNKKIGEPPPPPAPHPHRGSLENGNNPPTPPTQSSISSTSPSRVIGHLHSPQFTPVSAPVASPQLLSSMGSLTSPGQVSPHMVPGHPAAIEFQHKPAGNGVSPSRESVEAAIADIKQAIRRTKNLPLKTHPQEKQDRGPVWIPRSSRRDFAYTKKHASPPSTQTQMPGGSPHLHHPQESSPSGCSNISNKSEDRSTHDEDDGDTDQETDRLLGQQRSDDGFLEDKHNWNRLRTKPIIGMPLASNHKEGGDSEGGGGLNSNDSTPSTPSHLGSTGLTSSSPQDLLSTNQFIAKKEKEYGKKKGRSKEVMVHEPAVLIEGVLFRARYLGSTQLVSEGQPTKTTRMMQAEEAVSRIKAPEGEVQPSTEVDLFISTEKIMVLNTDLKEIMMDHALRTISYIADIGDLVVLMARRRVLPTDDQTENPSHRIPKMICHVFESDEAQFIAQSIGQAFQVAYLEFLKANGIEDHSFVKEMDYQEVLNSQEIFGDELQMFAKKELQKEVVVPKLKGDILGVVVVESGWGSMVPTVVIANLSPSGAAAKCGQLNIGDQIIAINGISLVGLPLSNCQNYIKNTKYNTAVKLTVVPCPPVVEVKIRRPDTKYQLGFSVQNGVICSLLRGGIAERGGVRVGHRIIDINSQSVVAVPHEKIVNLLATSVGEIRMKTMPTSIFRLLTGQETPQYI